MVVAGHSHLRFDQKHKLIPENTLFTQVDHVVFRLSQFLSVGALAHELLESVPHNLAQLIGGLFNFDIIFAKFDNIVE